MRGRNPFRRTQPENRRSNEPHSERQRITERQPAFRPKDQSERDAASSPRRSVRPPPYPRMPLMVRPGSVSATKEGNRGPGNDADSNHVTDHSRLEYQMAGKNRDDDQLE